MTKSPAYQWYPKDILSSQRVAMMDAKTECWYRRALDFCWVHGSVPADPKKLAAMIGKGCTSRAAESEIAPMFSIHAEDASKLIHDRQEQERIKQAEWLRKSSEAGKKSAEVRAARKQPTFNQKSKVGSTNLQPNDQGWLPIGSNQSANQIPTLQSSSSSSVKEEKKECASAQEISSSESGSEPTAEQPQEPEETFQPPPRVAHAPPIEQVQLYFTMRGVPELIDDFLIWNDARGWTFSNGEKIVHWAAWAGGWIKKAREKADKEQKAAEKKAAEAAKPKPSIKTADELLEERRAKANGHVSAKH